MANTPLNTLFLLALSYSFVLGARALVPCVGIHGAFSGALLVAFATVALTRDPPLRPRGAERRRETLRLSLGLAFGWVSYPLWLWLILALGRLLGLDAPPSAPPTGAPMLHGVVALVVFGPLFEELLWRERVYLTLRPIGRPLAVLLTSAGFAATHVEPWAVLTTFLLGLLLGSVYARSGSIPACIGVHAALNACRLVYGLPPTFAVPASPVDG
jgi:membrane protease YdiL (CAAX protease family)